MRFCDISWIIRDHYLGNTFFDASASAFIMPNLLKEHVAHSQIPSQEISSQFINEDNNNNNITQSKTIEQSPPNTTSSTSSSFGVALGPEWIQKTNLRGKIQHQDILNRQGVLNIEYGQEVCGIYTPPSSSLHTDCQNIDEIKWQRIPTRDQQQIEEYTIPNWNPITTTSTSTSSTNTKEQYPLYLHTTGNKVIYY